MSNSRDQNSWFVAAALKTELQGLVTSYALNCGFVAWKVSWRRF